jgi:hypothetical protein
MRTIPLCVLGMLLIAVSASAQDRNEVAKLRLYLGVPEKTPINFSKSRDFKIEQPVRVVINSGDDPAPAKEVVSFIDETNKSGKPGNIQIVSDPGKANLFLIQYEVEGKRRRDMVNSMSMDPALGKGRTDFIEKMQVRGYIVARKSEGLEVLVRFEREVVVSEPRKELRDAFARFLKEHSRK